MVSLLPQKSLLMVPGPVSCHPDVLKALATSSYHPRDPQFIAIFRTALQGLRHVFSSPKGQPVVFNGGGMLAMEAACASLIEPGDLVLIVENGYFGQSLTSLIQHYTEETLVLSAPLGERVTTDAIKAALDASDCKFLAFSHVDSGSGICAQIQELAKVAKKRNMLTIVDAVASVGGERLEQDKWGLDVCFASPQKALAGPPGLAILMLGQRAIQQMENRSTPIRSFNLDLTHWVTSMQSYEKDPIPRLVSTPATNLITGLAVALEVIQQEGLKNRIQRHRTVATTLRRELSNMNFEQVPRHPDFYSNTVTTFFAPKEKTSSQLVNLLLNEGVRIAPGLGKYRDQILRIGHMGAVTQSDVNTVIKALKKVL